MKKILEKLIVSIAMLFPVFAAASQPTQCLSLFKVYTSDIDDEIEVPVKRHRLPSAPIECVITSDGIYVQNSSIDFAEAVSYEIWDAGAEVCLAAYIDESAFIDGLLSVSGEFQVRFIFADYELSGNVVI